MSYYRAIPSDCECGKLSPVKNTTERLHKDGVVRDTFDPMRGDYNHSCILSEEEVLSFAKTPGGAILGATSGKMIPSGGVFGGGATPEQKESGIRGGNFNICETEEKPDIFVKSPYLDFPILDEVRYTRPVETRKRCEINIDEKTKNEILNANDDMLSALYEFEELEIILNEEIDDWEVVRNVIDRVFPEIRARGDAKILELKKKFNRQCGVKDRAQPNIKRLLEHTRDWIG